jgi:hypothetical protein
MASFVDDWKGRDIKLALVMLFFLCSQAAHAGDLADVKARGKLISDQVAVIVEEGGEQGAPAAGDWMNLELDTNALGEAIHQTGGARRARHPHALSSRKLGGG